MSEVSWIAAKSDMNLNGVSVNLDKNGKVHIKQKKIMIIKRGYGKHLKSDDTAANINSTKKVTCTVLVSSMNGTLSLQNSIFAEFQDNQSQFLSS